MKNLLVMFLMVLLTQQALAAQCSLLESKGFTSTQINTLYRAFQYGIEHDMSYSLAAIAWKESSAGIALKNPNDPSAGVFHVTVKNALYYVGWKNTEPNRQVMYLLLQLDFDMAASFAVKNLTFWRNAHKVSWKKTWQYYNGGTTYSNASIEYSEDIAKKIRTIKSCDWG
jgi:hypothetical protein